MYLFFSYCSFSNWPLLVTSELYAQNIKILYTYGHTYTYMYIYKIKQNVYSSSRKCTSKSGYIMFIRRDNHICKDVLSKLWTDRKIKDLVPTVYYYQEPGLYLVKDKNIHFKITQTDTDESTILTHHRYLLNTEHFGLYK